MTFTQVVKKKKMAVKIFICYKLEKNFFSVYRFFPTVLCSFSCHYLFITLFLQEDQKLGGYLYSSYKNNYQFFFRILILIGDFTSLKGIVELYESKYLQTLLPPAVSLSVFAS